MSTSLDGPIASTEKEAEVRQMLAKLWWMPLVRGILLILFGLLMHAQPAATLVSLIIFLGAYWLVGGVFDQSRCNRPLPRYDVPAKNLRRLCSHQYAV